MKIWINDEHIILDQLPMPQTSNKMYPVVNGTKVMSRFAKNYKKQFEYLRLKNLIPINSIKEWMLSGTHCKGRELVKLYRIDRYFQFHASNLWTKAGPIKKMDVTNRIKAFDDCLGDILGFDDCEIWKGTEEKIEIPGYCLECVTVAIKFHKHRTRESLTKSLGISY